ncbi:hypothetical protein JTF08_06020 [Micrococcaceae bacterium RIT802]|nr:hypothetical protein [Micrococcaceae bacterium RIT 802]
MGGSGGGFAALKFAARLGSTCSVFVWNAQTDLLKYSPRFVRNYLSLALGFSQVFLRGSDWIEASRERMEPDISTTVLEPSGGLRPRRLFYLQNAGDWHVDTHFLPWAKANDFRSRENGVASADPHHVALVAQAAPGHHPPPTPLVTDIIRRLQDAHGRPLELAEALLAQEPLLSQGVSQIPDFDLG